MGHKEQLQYPQPDSGFLNVAKGLLPYHGLGSGIKRALDKWPQIEFTDDHDGCLFTATVHRNPAEELDLMAKETLKVPIKGQAINLSGQPDPKLTLRTIKDAPSADYQNNTVKHL